MAQAELPDQELGNARELTLALLAARSGEATVCPSEVARALVAVAGAEATSQGWRRVMPAVHEAVDGLVADGLVQLSWKHRPLPTRAGPYRIGRSRRG